MPIGSRSQFVDTLKFIVSPDSASCQLRLCLCIKLGLWRAMSSCFPRKGAFPWVCWRKGCLARLFVGFLHIAFCWNLQAPRGVYDPAQAHSASLITAWLRTGPAATWLPVHVQREAVSLPSLPHCCHHQSSGECPDPRRDSPVLKVIFFPSVRIA